MATPSGLTMNEMSLLATELHRPLDEAELARARDHLAQQSEDTSQAEGFNRHARRIVHHMRRQPGGDDHDQAVERIRLQRAMDAAVVARYHQIKREGRAS